jgi:hypothetical protein
MITINKNYFRAFGWLRNYPLVGLVRNYFYPEEVVREDTIRTVPDSYKLNYINKRSRFRQLLGSFQPVADIAKDFIDTFKPYKSRFHIKRDFLQPWWGTVNIVKGVVTIVAAPFFVLFVGYQILSASKFKGMRLRVLVNNLVNPISWIIEGVLNIVRGFTQLITTPVTWLVKMPFRGILTAIMGTPTIEQNLGMRNLVKIGKLNLEQAVESHEQKEEAGKALTQPMLPKAQFYREFFLNRTGEAMSEAQLADCVRYEIHRKYLKSLLRGQPTFINDDRERRLFEAQNYQRYSEYPAGPIRTDRATAGLQYLGLFSTDRKAQAAILTEPEVTTCYEDDDEFRRQMSC